MEQVFGVLVLGVGAAAVLALMFSGWWGGWGWWGDVSQTVTVNVDAGKATEGANAVALAALAVLARQSASQAQASISQFVAPVTWAWDAERQLWRLAQPDGSLLLSDGRAMWREAIPTRELPRITVMGRAVEALPHWMDDSETGIDAERDAAEVLSRRLPAPRGG